MNRLSPSIFNRRCFRVAAVLAILLAPVQSAPAMYAVDMQKGTLKSMHFSGTGVDFLVFIQPGQLQITGKDIHRWVTQSTQAVADYYGRFPVRKVVLTVKPTSSNSAVVSKTTKYDKDGHFADIKIELGDYVTGQDLDASPTLVHEMLKLGFPKVDSAQRWLPEGIATYVQGTVRARAGAETTEQVWQSLVEGLPKGLPKEDDKGLSTATKDDRVCWGGALFSLLADVEIRKQTQNKRGLEDAVCAIARGGGLTSTGWTISRIMMVADKADGTHVLSELYDRMNEKPISADLRGLWTYLGVQDDNGTVVFDDTAPGAAIRQAITAK